MMIVGLSKHMRNGLACKSKWRTISRKFKIFEYTLRTSHNEDWMISSQDKATMH